MVPIHAAYMKRDRRCAEAIRRPRFREKPVVLVVIVESNIEHELTASGNCRTRFALRTAAAEYASKDALRGSYELKAV